MRLEVNWLSPAKCKLTVCWRLHPWMEKFLLDQVLLHRLELKHRVYFNLHSAKYLWVLASNLAKSRYFTGFLSSCTAGVLYDCKFFQSLSQSWVPRYRMKLKADFSARILLAMDRMEIRGLCLLQIESRPFPSFYSGATSLFLAELNQTVKKKCW